MTRPGSGADIVSAQTIALEGARNDLRATYFDGSVANALRTSDWETPNCRAIRDGVIPALKEARIAFT